MKKYAYGAAVLTVFICLGAPAYAEAARAQAPLIDLTAVINAAIALTGAVLTYKVIPYLKERMSAAQFGRMEAMINVAVYAAEEIYRSGRGDEKLSYARNYLRGKGYDVDVEQIKAAVRRMRDAQTVGLPLESAELGELDEQPDIEPV